ncbi:hypothetical protein JMK10_18380 [Rhodovulum sulfidophilum]|uniref:hypothetical protein n=1 Tax=Rhodovulum sulfidophilum TaxID=35806 RepID=UPI001924F2F1|nr:hypothetical protein [Rhodovulum sulfidophilum]MBL3573568.1 hypothetical protein [Rhodovulum sulfidophilum]MCE8429974.1 hypothetical protein [Rhodovulum sulfidophilum]MCF4118714.1 hypothetical protein [Rhodovulum sulfidophilum]
MGLRCAHWQPGKRRWRFRKGGFSGEFGSDYSSEDFIRRYEAALEGHRTLGGVGAGHAKAGGVGLLVSKWYRSQDFSKNRATALRSRQWQSKKVGPCYPLAAAM